MAHNFLQLPTFRSEKSRSLGMIFSSLIVLLLLTTSSVFGQFSADKAWKFVQFSDIKANGTRYIYATKASYANIDMPVIKGILASVPQEGKNTTSSKKFNFTLPMPDGSYKRFFVYESSIMAPELQAQYPEIRTYTGQGFDDPTAVVRLDVTPLGFHAMIISADGTTFIDPITLGTTEYYIVYDKQDFITDKKMIGECVIDVNPNWASTMRENRGLVFPSGTQLRTYRLAVASTKEYTNYFGGTVALGMAAIVTSVNRVNLVYEKEVAVRMVLIANNNLLVCTNSNPGSYSNSNGSAMLAQNQTRVDQLIGTANYDIGHVFSTGGGGVAYLGCVCVAGEKASGVTGSGAPIGDPFDIDYVAHEMGHQFGGNHPFNGSAGSCSGGNRNASTAWEPGSGSTIMAYAGICSPQDLQPNSDAYFHVGNLDEIIVYTTLANGYFCPTTTATGNHYPTVTTQNHGLTIPMKTPFTLTGSATDSDGDALTYCWEQFDLGPAGAPGSPSGDAPIFRSWKPALVGSRTFPRITDLVNNTTVIGEILPTYARTLHFILTARDNKAGGGGMNYDTLSVKVSAAAGPFLVTYPNTAVSVPALSTQTITWNVANTNIAPVNCTTVDIFLSKDGGLTYPYSVASNVPNNGSASVTIPDQLTTTARIKVAGNGNVFFDISNVNFIITAAIPVELVSFNAINKGNEVQLLWSTATETNNAGFEIQKSFDKVNFSAIGFVPGKGTSTQLNSYSFNEKLTDKGTLSYRLKQIDLDGSAKLSQAVEVEVLNPTRYSLEQNYPNPFNPTTSISYSVPEISNVTLRVYDNLGNEIATLVNEIKQTGYYSVSFDASKLSSGVYFYTLRSNNFTASKKLILMK